MTNQADQHISVLTLNPAVDISYEVPQLLEYQKVCATQTWHHPGGNGINVARSLATLEVPVHCCSAIGGESGEMLLRLLGDTPGVTYTWFRLAGETRLNTTVLQQNPPGQYEVTSLGPEVPPDVLAEISDCFLRSTGKGLGVLTGQVPRGVPDTLYRDMAEKIAAQGGRAVVDAHGPELAHALDARPFMVRVNRHVLEMTIRQRLEDTRTVAEAARAIQQRGIDYVCVSLGDQGAVLADADNSWHCAAPRVHKQSTVGSGDALLAALIAEWRNGSSAPQMLRLGVICGSATASKPGTGLFAREEVEAHAPELEISELGI
jgi:6-phosphofructokinase 2